jgi:F-type H+-transporting ATPase subunit delta
MAGKRDLIKRATKVILNRIEKEELIKVLDFLKFVQEIYKKDKNFRDLILNDQISLEEKKKIFATLLEKSSIKNKETLQELLEFLTKKHLFRFLPLIIRYLQYETENVLGRTKAKIITAGPIDEELQKKLIEILENKLNKTIETELEEDPEIIGGFIVKTTAFIVDASVKNVLKEYLISSP